METHDRRIVHARQFLADARRRDPAELTLDELVREDAELRRCLGWAIDVADDWAATDLDDGVTQVVPLGTWRPEGTAGRARNLDLRADRGRHRWGHAGIGDRATPSGRIRPGGGR